MKTRTMRFLTCATAVVVGAQCGGQVDSVPDFGDASAFAPPPSDAVPYDDRFGALLDVSGGYAVLGHWRLDGGRLVPYACNEALATSARRVIVAPFRLMEREVTNGAYALCVNAGACRPPDGDSKLDPAKSAWDDPSRQGRPVAVSFTTARAFCRHYGGDLPTEGEWVRAGAGDSSEFGVAKLSQRFLSCKADTASSPDCAAMLVAAFREDSPGVQMQYRSLRDVATATWDKGPFGHLDLFANAAEWTRSVPRVDLGAGCVDGRFDADIYAPSESLMPGDHAVTASPILSMLGGLAYTDGSAFLLGPDHVIESGDYYDGFRCAFPNK